jgi:hypothetical protein
VCVAYDPTYIDGVRGRKYPALGALVEVFDGAPRPQGDPPPLVWSGWLSESDGCSPPFAVDPDRPYDVALTSKLKVRGNVVEVKNQADETLFSHRWPGERLAPDTARTLQTPDSVATRILAGVTLGIASFRETSGHTLRVWAKTQVGATPCAGTSCNARGGVFYAASGRPDQTNGLFTLLHEMGHAAMGLRVRESQTQVPHKGNAPGTARCPGGDAHRRDSIEWHAMALAEGFAHFFAATVVNPGPTDPCKCWSHYQVDWNHDGRKDGNFYRCDGPPVDRLGVSSVDYLGDQCGPRIPPGVANEFDYQRFFWSLYRQEGLSVNQILDVIARANEPTGWNATWESGSPNNARDRLQRAADGLGIGEKWQRQALRNGVAR